MNLILSLLLALSSPAHAQALKPPSTATQIMAAMLTGESRLAAWECQLQREEVTEPGAKPKLMTGRLRVKAGGKALFEISGPTPQSVVSDGKTVWMVIPEAKQVMRQTVQSLKTSGQFFIDLGQSIRYYSKNSRSRLVPVGSGFDPVHDAALELTPADPAKCGFDKVVVWVSRQDWMIRQVSMDSGGVQVMVRFKDLRATTKEEVRKDPGKDLPDTLFDFKVPEGYEVFDSLIP